MKAVMTNFSHIPVLRDEAVNMLRVRDHGVYLDGTFGGGGYAKAILDSAACRLVAIDRDPAAVARAQDFARAYPDRFAICEGRFSDLSVLLEREGVTALDGAVFDLGVSSYQIDDPARGFSFRHNGPLDMQMGSSTRDAAQLVNFCSESELADILYEYGDEKASRKIAKAIVERRRTEKFETTSDLAGVIRSIVRPDKSGIDPATRSFQALRIAVNEELSDIAAALTQAADLLGTGGRLVVVSFHSLEDRIVKRFFAAACGRLGGASRHDPAGFTQGPAARFALVTKAAVGPSEAEMRANPRARSAKMRVMERLAP